MTNVIAPSHPSLSEEDSNSPDTERLLPHPSVPEDPWDIIRKTEGDWQMVSKFVVAPVRDERRGANLRTGK